MAKLIANMDSLLKKLDRLGGDCRSAIKRGMKTTLQATEDDAEAFTKYGRVKATTHNEFLKDKSDVIEGRVFCNHPAVQYIEFGTGPVGAANHSGVSPNIPLTYHPTSWAYHSEEYGWVTTKGQPAKPFLYPAAKQNESVFEGEVKKELLNEIRRAGG